MLSVTAEALNRKDIALVEANKTIEELNGRVEKLTTNNNQLQSKVRHLEAQIKNMEKNGVSDFQTSRTDQFFEFEHDEEKDMQDGGMMNGYLLEAVFGMARMVETVSIQAAREACDTMEGQVDANFLFQMHDSANVSGDLTRITTLTDMKPDVFLLHWFSHQLRESTIAKAMNLRGIKNFTSELRDGKRYTALLHHLYPGEFDEAVCNSIQLSVHLIMM